MVGNGGERGLLGLLVLGHQALHGVQVQQGGKGLECLGVRAGGVCARAGAFAFALPCSDQAAWCAGGCITFEQDKAAGLEIPFIVFRTIVSIHEVHANSRELTRRRQLQQCTDFKVVQTRKRGLCKARTAAGNLPCHQSAGLVLSAACG